MTRGVLSLPPERLAGLRAGYQAETAKRRRATALGVAIVVLLLALSSIQAEVSPSRLFDNIGNFASYIDRIFRLDSHAPVWTDPAEWFWGWKRWLRLLGETLLMAYVATLMGALGGFCLSFLSVGNLTRSPWIRLTARRLLEFFRTVPDLVYALIYVVAFGLGAVPGVLAIASHTVGALGKQFADIVETVDSGPIDGATASGASWAEVIRFAVLPQVFSNFASVTLLRFEINVRSAGVVGLVGAGGIGRELITSIRRFQYSDVSALLVLLIVTVMIIDALTSRLRYALLAAEAS